MRRTGDGDANTRARKIKSTGAARGRRHALLCAAAGMAIAAAIPASPALALSGIIAGAGVIATPVVGGTVVNPLTGATETVVQVLSPISVVTNQNNSILLVNQVGDTFTANGLNYTVTAVTVDAGTGLVSKVTVQDNQSTPVTSTIDRVADQSGSLVFPPATTGGNSGTTFTPVIPAGNNVYSDQRRGSDGGDGHAGGGVSVCIPVIGCATIA